MSGTWSPKWTLPGSHGRVRAGTRSMPRCSSSSTGTRDPGMRRYTIRTFFDGTAVTSRR